MEGVGSRLGRASSRYGPSTTAAVFSGPVRKWKRKWVHVSTNTNTNTTNTNTKTSSLPNAHKNSTNGGGSRLLLFRWTPVSSPAAAEAEEKEEGSPPRRRFRYTPVVTLEDRSKAAKKVDDMAGSSQLSSMGTSKGLELNRYDSLKAEAQGHDMTHLDLELSLKENSDPESDSPSNRAEAGGF